MSCMRYIANLMPNAPQRLALRTLHDSTEILTDKMAEQERRLGLFGWLLFMSRPVRVSPTKISHPLDKDGIFLKTDKRLLPNHFFGCRLK